jgi:hypothetical protein
VAVDGDHHVIVAIDVGNQASDAGYGSSLNLEECKERALDAYISANRQRDGKRPRAIPEARAPDLDARGLKDRKLRSVTGAGRSTPSRAVQGSCGNGLKG